MEANKEKKLDDFIRKSVQEIGLESPSPNFTESILSKIKASGQSTSVTVYKPLISKVGWAIVLLIIGSLSGLALFGQVDTNLAWLEKINLGAIPRPQFLDALPSLALSNTMLYSLMIFAAFAILHMFLLKLRLDKRFTVN